VSKPEGLVGQLLLGPMSIHQRVVFGRWVCCSIEAAAAAAVAAELLFAVGPRASSWQLKCVSPACSAARAGSLPV
jgi:hypothetical protein